MKTVKVDHEDIINLAMDLEYKSYEIAKKSVRSTLKGTKKNASVLRGIRKDLRSKIIRSTKETTMKKKTVNKRFQMRSWTNKKMRLSDMHASMLMADWAEDAGTFSRGAPKKVGSRGKLNYYKPNLSTFGKKLVKGGKKQKIFKPHSYRRSGKKGDDVPKRTRKKWNHLFVRKGDPRLPLKYNARSGRRVKAGSMYELFFKKTMMGKNVYENTKSRIRKMMQHNLDFFSGKIIKGKPKKRASIAK